MEINPEFASAGMKDGLEVWRIENLKPVPYPKEKYGSFHVGDSYIVLKTSNYDNGAQWNIHFWLGAETSQDEAGAAAILSVNLDDHLGGKPIQYRELQDHESPLFLSYFQFGIRYLPGGVVSGFHHVEPDAFEKKLYQVKGFRNVRVKPVEPHVSAMNHGDCFILDTGETIFIYVGRNSRCIERFRAVCIADRIKNEDHGGRPKLKLIDDHCKDEDVDEFFRCLGSGSPTEIPSDSEVEPDREFELSQERTVSLYRVSDDSGELKVEAVSEKPFYRSSLDSNDCFILDAVTNIYIWIGKKSNSAERLNIMRIAEQYLTSKNYPRWTQIQRIVEDAEPTAFTEYFKSWDGQRSVQGRLVRQASRSEQESWEARLFHASIKPHDGEDQFHVEQVFNFKQGDIFPDDVMILDLGTKVYLWVGHFARKEEFLKSDELVKKYLEKSGRDDVEVVKINHGEEDETFKKQFPDWQENFMPKSDHLGNWIRS